MSSPEQCVEAADLHQEVKDWLAAAKDSLPKQVLGFGKYKLPFKITCHRVCLFWRIEELGRSALHSFENGNIVAGMTLTRAAAETAAALWHIKEFLERQLREGISDDFDKQIMKHIMGNKLQDGPYEAINVLTFIKSIGKASEAFEYAYDVMSEYAHPNSRGTTRAYSKPDVEKVLVNFSSNPEDQLLAKESGLAMLSGALLLFEHSYNEVDNLMDRIIEAWNSHFDEKLAQKVTSSD
jgi:hypothetical protein